MEEELKNKVLEIPPVTNVMWEKVKKVLITFIVNAKAASIIAFNNIKNVIKTFWSFATSKPNARENAFQYIARQFILTDSDGNPSWTVTALVFVMGIIGVAVYTEYRLAMSSVIKYGPDGKVIAWSLRGFSTEFYYLVISLSVVITGLFRARQKDNAAKAKNDDDSNGDSDSSTISTVIDTAKAVIGKMKG